MRTYGRVYDSEGNATWQEVTTDSTGSNDYVYITTLIQNLKLNVGESPFYANCGIPAHASIVQQIFPDYYVSLIQQQFSGYFAALTITRQATGVKPVYQVNITTNQGVKVAVDIPT